MNMVSGIFIGAVIGCGAGFGFLQLNVKMSQRHPLMLVIPAAGAVLGAAGGGRIGYQIDRALKIDRALGIDQIHHQHEKTGRFWSSRSVWRDCLGQDHVLLTAKGKQVSESTYNDTLLMSHGHSASSVNITRFHKAALNELLKVLRQDYGEEYLGYLKAKK